MSLLKFFFDEEGKKTYTLVETHTKHVVCDAHPVRFSPDDNFSRERLLYKNEKEILLERAAEKLKQFFDTDISERKRRKRKAAKDDD